MTAAQASTACIGHAGSSSVPEPLLEVRILVKHFPVRGGVFNRKKRPCGPPMPMRNVEPRTNDS